MCIIIVNKDGQLIQDEVLIKSATINPHGLGITWLDTMETEYYSSEDYGKLRDSRPYVAHFRYATIGKVCLENNHPFTITGTDCLLYQNGSVLNLGDDQMTDTQHMADILSNLNPTYWADVLEMSDCRWVIVDTKAGTVDLYNEEMFIDRNGIQYSKGNVLDGELVAVYGTLKEGLGNHYTMGNSKLLGHGKTVNKYPMIDVGIPYVYPEKGVGHQIVVEVYMADKKQLEGPIDRLEGHPHHYKRMKTLIELENGDVVSAWLYFSVSDRNPKDPLIDEFVREKSLSLFKPTEHLSTWHDDGISWDNQIDIFEKLDNSCCDKCGHMDTIWDEQANELWCYTCDDYTKSVDIDYSWTSTK